MSIRERGFETERERHKRLFKDVTVFFGALSSGAGIYVLGVHILDGNFGAIGHAIWSFLSNFSNLWYKIASPLLGLEFGQSARNAISLYLVFGATAARAWYIFSSERPIEYRLRRNRLYWGIPDEFVSETVCESELKSPLLVTIVLPFAWPLLLPVLYRRHDGLGNAYHEDILDPHEPDGLDDDRIVVKRTRASYRRFLWYQIGATMTVGLFILSADAVF